MVVGVQPLVGSGSAVVGDFQVQGIEPAAVVVDAVAQRVQSVVDSWVRNIGAVAH